MENLAVEALLPEFLSQDLEERANVGKVSRGIRTGQPVGAHHVWDRGLSLPSGHGSKSPRRRAVSAPSWLSESTDPVRSCWVGPRREGETARLRGTPLRTPRNETEGMVV